MKKRKFIIPVIILLLIGIWLKIVYTEYCQVGINWNKPNFCILVDGADDGGSGKYIGLGYSFDIEGNFVTENEYRGVEKYTFNVLGITIKKDEINH